MRDFNTAGPVRPHRHYSIPPLERFDLEERVFREERDWGGKRIRVWGA